MLYGVCRRTLRLAREQLIAAIDDLMAARGRSSAPRQEPGRAAPHMPDGSCCGLRRRPDHPAVKVAGAVGGLHRRVSKAGTSSLRTGRL